MKLTERKKKWLSAAGLICFVLAALLYVPSWSMWASIQDVIYTRSIYTLVEIAGYIIGFGTILAYVCAAALQLIKGKTRMLAVAGIIQLFVILIRWLSLFVMEILLSTTGGLSIGSVLTVVIEDLVPLLLSCFLILCSVVKAKGASIPIMGMLLVLMNCCVAITPRAILMIQNLSTFGGFGLSYFMKLVIHFCGVMVALLVGIGLMMLVPAALYAPAKEEE